MAPSIAVSIGVESSISGDGAFWLGAQLSACARVGPSCAGLVARISEQQELRSDDETYPLRIAGEAALAVDLPIVGDSMSFFPGLELGAGLVHTARWNAEETITVTKDRLGLRAGAHLSLVRTLGAGFSLSAGLSVAVDPFASTTIDTTRALDLPGDPLIFVRGALGVRYEGGTP